MPLSKKHYKAFAEVLGNNCVDTKSPLVQDIIRLFRIDNPRFDELRFIYAIDEIKNEMTKCQVKG